MELIVLDSGTLYAVAYTPETQELLAVFTSLVAFVYVGVPQDVYDKLLKAEDPGTFVRSEITGKYHERSLKK